MRFFLIQFNFDTNEQHFQCFWKQWKNTLSIVTLGVFFKWHYNSFGSIMPGREYTAQSAAGYRFGFNTQKDDEIYGKGNASSAEFWEYDTRLGEKVESSS